MPEKKGYPKKKKNGALDRKKVKAKPKAKTKKKKAVGGVQC